MTARITAWRRPKELPFAGLALLLVLLCLITTSISAQHYQVLHHFNGDDDREPGSLVLSGLTLFGAAGRGGSFQSGVIFKMNTDGSGFIVLKEFAFTNGSTPLNLLLSGSTLYGITYQGGARSAGTVFKINCYGFNSHRISSQIGVVAI